MVLPFLLLLCATCAADAAGGGPSPAPDPPPLVLFGPDDYPPLSWLDHGTPRGIDVDLGRAIARQMGRELRVELLEWGLAQARVRAGEGNGLLAITPSVERAANFDFSDTTAVRARNVFVRSADASIRSLADLPGKRIGAVHAGASRIAFEQQPRVTFVSMRNYADGFGLLAAGAIDAVAADHWAGTFAAQQRGLTNVRPLEPPMTMYRTSLAVRKGDPLLADINAAIRRLRGDGTLARVEQAWWSQQVVFMTRESRQRIIGLSLLGLLLLLTSSMGIWVLTLRKQIQIRKRAELERTNSEHRLRLAMSAAEMGTWHWDAATGLSSRDSGLNRMLGLTDLSTTHGREEFFEAIHPGDLAMATAARAQAVTDRAPYTTEFRIVRPDATVRWLREKGRPFYDDTGTLTHVASVLVDVTAQRQMEKDLRVSEERFVTAFQASPDCIAISDRRGVVEINDRFEQVTGYPREFIIGRRLIDTGITDPHLRERIVAQLKETGSIRDFEYTIRTRSGEVRDILLSAELITIGGRNHWLSVNRDITNQKRAEEALRTTEVQYRELVENANDIIFTADREGTCLSMNRIGQQITGYIPTDNSRINLRQLIAPEEHDRIFTQLARVMAGEDVKPFETSVVTADGRRVLLEVSVRPLREGATIVAMQGIARDVTARQELEAQLRQAQKMDGIGRLAAGVAHDFNNLLTVILAHCEASTPLLAPNDPLQNAVNGIRVAAERAASLTGQLLAFSRRQVTQPRVLDLNDVVDDIKLMMARLIGEDINVRFRPGEALWKVNADAGQIQQVVLNLAVNARDAMPHGGDLAIKTENYRLDGVFVQHPQMPPGDYVLISVSDSGLGMDDETLAHIFEPFFTTKEIGQGTGLGLATVYGIVKQSGGFVWVHSHVGTGSTFKIFLPRTQEVAPLEMAPVVREEVVAGDETILLVEDEADLREILEHYLESKGYTVVSAGDGQACLAACRGRTPFPRLLVTDVVMPGMSGRELADQLRRTNPAIKVLYLSGYTDDAVLRHGILPNHTQFLQKPFALHDLASRVRQILDAPQAAASSADLS